ncbi:hypothetical protein KS32_004654 [Salmonella enterica subsp. enterica]|nr:hypothetical protein [Salmonella enterica subsp. enterica serovar Liverpool]
MSNENGLVKWLQSGEYLPRFLRDFHDQKDVFKAMHDTIGNANENGNARDGHIYVIDTFLWYMARCGYTLQKSRKNVEFKDMQDDIEHSKEWRREAFSRVISEQHKVE